MRGRESFGQKEEDDSHAGGGLGNGKRGHKGKKIQLTSVSNHIVDKAWQIVAEIFLRTEALRKVNDPRRRIWKTMMYVPWWMSNGSDPDNPVFPNEMYPWNPAGGIEDQNFVTRKQKRLPDEELWLRDSALEGPWSSGG